MKSNDKKVEYKINGKALEVTYEVTDPNGNAGKPLPAPDKTNCDPELLKKLDQEE